MDKTVLYKKYFADDTTGSRIIRKFYFTHHQLMIQNSYIDFNDLAHDIFLNISKIDFEKVKNEQHYIHRSIKIQCWAVLDKIYSKSGVITPETRLTNDRTEFSLSETPSGDPDPHGLMESDQLMVTIARFKRTLPSEEMNILNTLIDEHNIALVDMARRFHLNENTVRTKIRRLRISFEEYLRKNGHV